MQIFDEITTARHLPFHNLIAAIEQTMIEGCTVPLRHIHAVDDGEGQQVGTLLLMPAWQGGKRLGVKTVSIFPGNRDHGFPGLHSVYVLYDASTGKPLAILDGDVITSRRTAAASALAARSLSRPDSRTLLIVGAGRVASLLADAYRAVRPIEKVLVWNISADSATKLVHRLRADGISAEHVRDLEAATQKADIVSCATLATQPLIHGTWLQPGTHLDLIGSFAPQMREADADCFRVASVFVDTNEALMKAGDILDAIASGAFEAAQVAATLEDLCKSRHPGRASSDQITLYKGVGTALADLAAASLAYDAACAE